MVIRRIAVVVVAIAFAAGCGGNKMLPPSPSGPPPLLRNAAGLALAEELLSVLGSQDGGLARVTTRVQDAYGKASRQADTAMKTDMALLFTVIDSAESGDAAAAERQLRELIGRSKDAIAE